MPIVVYHMKSDDCFRIDPKELNFPEDFEMVAVVDTENLGKAFELTNTIERLWTENEDVTASREQLRSTSVGDAMVKGDKIFQVAGIGFTEREDWLPK